MEESSNLVLQILELDNATTVTDLSNGNDGTVTELHLTMVTMTYKAHQILYDQRRLNSNRDGLGFYLLIQVAMCWLNGIDEYVQIQDNKVFSFGDSNGDLPFSIEAWIARERYRLTISK